MRRAAVFLLLLGGLGGALAQPAGDRLDVLHHRGLENPQAALADLNALPAAKPGDARRLYVETLLRLRSGERLAPRIEGLPVDGAVSWLLRAHAARLDGRSDEGLGMSTRAIGALRANCPLLAELGQAASAAPTASARPARAASDAGAHCDLRLAFDATLLTGRGLRDRGELLPALAQLQAAQQLARQLGDPRRIAQALMDETQLRLRRDELQLARQRIAEAHAQVQGQPLATAQVLVVEAQVARAAGAYPQQRRLLEEALALTQKRDAPALALLVQGNLADHFLLSDEPALARQVAEEALQHLASRSDARIENHLRHNLAVALIRLRAFDAARQQLALQAELTARGALPVRQRAEQLRELGQAWTGVAQWRDALQAYHAERQLTEQANERERAASLAELRRKAEEARSDAKTQAELAKQAKGARDEAIQKAQTIIVTLAGVLLSLGLAVGLMFWVGSQAAHRRLRRSQARLQDLAERDPLTQLANRRAFQLAMQQRGDRPIEGALLLIDIDHFKRINDTHGHAAGDAVLQVVANRLRGQVRQTDLLVRWGGEEFLLYCPGMPQAPLRLLAQRLLRALEETPVAVQGELTLAISASIGFAAWPLPPKGQAFGWEQAVNWVDLALYQAKQSGRARAVGIVGANLPDERAVTLVEADFAGAAAAARIELVTLRAKN